MDAGTVCREAVNRGCDITRSALAKIEVGQRHIYPQEIKALQSTLQVPYELLFV